LGNPQKQIREEYDREIAEERGQCSEPEEKIADDEPKHVAEG